MLTAFARMLGWLASFRQLDDGLAAVPDDAEIIGQVRTLRRAARRDRGRHRMPRR